MTIIFDGTLGITTPTETANNSVTTPVVKSSANLVFQSNGTTEAMRIDTSQNVGIGTAIPTKKLTVKGSSGIAAERDIDTDRMIVTYNDITNYANASGAGNYNNWTFTHSNNSGSDVRMQITTGGLFQFNSGYGSVATAYGTRAWVNFAGSSGSINASGGVSSVTRNGTGDYTVNYSFTFPDANYTMMGMGRRNSGAQRPVLMCLSSSGTYNQFTTSARFYTMLNDSATIEDPIQFWFLAVR